MKKNFFNMCRILLQIIFLTDFAVNWFWKKLLRKNDFSHQKKMAILLNKTISSDPILLKSCRLFYEIKNYKKKNHKAKSGNFWQDDYLFMLYWLWIMVFCLFEGVNVTWSISNFHFLIETFSEEHLKKNLSVYLPYFRF